MQPKVFISYSWSSPVHQETVKSWADRLIEDGVDVVLDIYDLKEGQDKYEFMESMVVDKTVSHVLVICDKGYSDKADGRVAGVGVESQIISKEVYDKVRQTKFIPIVCEYDDQGSACTPLFMSSRIYLNFSSLEHVNENWEQLIRLLHNKPLFQKPKLGKPPSYITSDDSEPQMPSVNKLASLKQAVLLGKPGVAAYRAEFLESCIAFADGLRVREAPASTDIEFAEKIIADATRLKGVRDQLVDWVLLEGASAEDSALNGIISDLLERLLELKSRPEGLNSYSDTWFEGHELFVYETFIYIVAALLRLERYSVLKVLFESHYLLGSTARYNDKKFVQFDGFWASSRVLSLVLKPAGGGTFKSTAAELIRLHADRHDITFAALREAELLILLMSYLPPYKQWFPQTLYYSSFHEEHKFFLRTTQRKNFVKLQAITGGKSVEELKQAVTERSKNLQYEFRSFSENSAFWDQMNLTNMDTLL
ncbi:TIR domain-containing protein [Pseudomonas veronii]|uniref:SEFIR domain-containing protein n=1 Tax=Pseudomonas veronii TaxID=76761 RepID=UPI0015A2ACBD|nr:SEFIR domain-containing protein [Pseudomonas veronii]NWD54994.1 TIR domain-containing protein [Pseudomonas veronii]